MDSIISTFHLDWKLMLAQLINFAIVVFVLWYFVFRPLGQKMTERTKTIEKSLAEAKEISQKLQETEIEKQAIIVNARKESKKIIIQAKTIAEDERQKSINGAKTEVKKVIDEGKNQLNQEKEKMVGQIKNEIADLIISATTKVLGKTVDKKIDQGLIKDALEQIKTKINR